MAGAAQAGECCPGRRVLPRPASAAQAGECCPGRRVLPAGEAGAVLRGRRPARAGAGRRGRAQAGEGGRRPARAGAGRRGRAQAGEGGRRPARAGAGRRGRAQAGEVLSGCGADFWARWRENSALDHNQMRLAHPESALFGPHPALSGPHPAFPGPPRPSGHPAFLGPPSTRTPALIGPPSRYAAVPQTGQSACSHAHIRPSCPHAGPSALPATTSSRSCRPVALRPRPVPATPPARWR